MEGLIVMEKVLEQKINEFDLDNIQSGLYFIEVRDKEEVMLSDKLIIQK